MNPRVAEPITQAATQKALSPLSLNPFLAAEHIANLLQPVCLQWDKTRLETNPVELVSNLLPPAEASIQLENIYKYERQQFKKYYDVYASKSVIGRYRIVVNLHEYLPALIQFKKLEEIKNFLNFVHAADHRWKIVGEKGILSMSVPCSGYILKPGHAPVKFDITQFNSLAIGFGLTPEVINEFKKHLKKQTTKVCTDFFITDPAFLEQLFEIAFNANRLCLQFRQSITHSFLNSAFQNLSKGSSLKRKQDEVTIQISKLFIYDFPKDVSNLIAEYINDRDALKLIPVCKKTFASAKATLFASAPRPVPTPPSLAQPQHDNYSMLA